MDKSANFEAKKIHINNLMRMVEFCENVTECRRSQILAYFAETFTKEQCRAISSSTCDNCLKGDDYKVRISVIRLPKSIYAPRASRK